MFLKRIMLKIKLYYLALLFLCLLSLIVMSQVLLHNELPHGHESIVNGTNIVIWWTPFITLDRKRDCGTSVCLITANRSLINQPGSKGFLFYGSRFNQSDLPLPRGDKIWGLFHEESPRNVPVFSHEPALSLFNFSSTFSRFSNIPLTFQFLPSLEEITSSVYFKTFKEKNEFQKDLAPVMYIQTDCSTPNNRDSYVAELMKHIDVDSYGQCLNNKQLPESLRNSMETMMSPELLELTSKYKFTLAFENAICEDYITEKIWRPIIAGSLPIYIGSPSIKDWLPNDKTVVLPSEFQSPKDLAKFLLFLNENETAYDEYFDHKMKNNIENERLLRDYRTVWPDSSLGVIEEFECLICQKLHSPGPPSVVPKSHYDCPEPVSVLDHKINTSNHWLSIYKSGKCEALALKEFVENNMDKNSQFIFDPYLQLNKNCLQEET